MKGFGAGETTVTRSARGKGKGRNRLTHVSDGRGTTGHNSTRCGILERSSLETKDEDACSNQEDAQPLLHCWSLVENNRCKDGNKQEAELVHRRDLRRVTHLQRAKVADPRSTRGQPGQNQKEPGLRSEREWIAPFPGKIDESCQGDTDHERADKRGKIRMDAF